MSFEHRDSLLCKLLLDKQQAMRTYEQQAQPKHPLPGWLRTNLRDALLQPDWVGVAIDFTLETPWYSRDDVTWSSPSGHPS